MADMLVKGMPAQLHRRLKDSARRHHRSMNKEALAILEEKLLPSPPKVPDIEPYEGPFRITGKWLNKAIKAGRE